MNTHKRHLIILLALLLMGWTIPAKAVHWDPWGNPSSSGYSCQGTFTMGQDEYLSYTVKLTGDLTIQTTGNYTFYKAWNYGDNDTRTITHMFETNGYKLTIKGVDGGHITLDAGASYIDGDARKGLVNNEYATTPPGYGVQNLKTGAIIYATGSRNVVLQNVTLQNNFNTTATVHTAGQGSGVTHNLTANRYGGAIDLNANYTGTVTMTDCTIKACTGTFGGGIYFDGSGDYSLNNVEIFYCFSDRVTIGSGNTGGNGGAIYIQNGNVSITNNCTFHDCKSEASGGGVFATVSSSLTMTDCEIHHCNAPGGSGGGVFASVSSSLTMTDCEIHHCNATGGSGIEISGTTVANLTGVIIHDCINIGGGGGGGAFSSGAGSQAIATLDNCEFYNNEASWGGAVSWYAGGSTTAKLTIKGNTKIHHNTAGYAGGGIYGSANIDIQSAEIYNNTATSEHPYVNGVQGLYVQAVGGGIYLYPYSGSTRGYSGGLKFHMGSGVSVHDNTAWNKGGGICIEVLASDFAPYKYTRLYGQDPSVAQDDYPIYDDGPLPGEEGWVENSSKHLTLCDVKIEDGGQIYNNTAEQGGGLCVLDYSPKWHKHTSNGKWSGILDRKVVVEGGEIKNNTSKNQSYTYQANTYFSGGGVYIYKGPLMSGPNSTTMNLSHAEDYGYSVTGGTIGNCIHPTWGSGTLTVSLPGGDISGNAAVSSSGKESYGGGVCVWDDFKNLGHPEDSFCNVTVSGSAEVYDNESNQYGGGLHVNYGTVKIEGTPHIGKSGHPNKVLNGSGGGFAVLGGTLTVTGGTIAYNEASSMGGGFYVDPGAAATTTVQNASGSTVVVNNNKAANGAGAYVNSGTLKVQSANTSFEDNEASTNGGGIYANGGTVNVNSGSKIVGNKALNGCGGALYSNGGTTTIDCRGTTYPGYIGSSAKPNKAKYGGGIYANGGTVNLTSGKLQYNEATQDGGGIYANGGTVNVEYASDDNGTVDHNYAGNRGGGLFISETGVLNLKNHATITKNHVPLGCLGGGVYLEGTVQAGASSSDVITVKDNYAANTAPASYDPVPSDVRNNIYLPDPEDTKTTDVITIVNNGLDRTNSRIGFSVPGNYVPVIYCSNTTYIAELYSTYSASIFEDSERFRKFYSTTSPYSANYIYLYSDTWASNVTTMPSDFNINNIDSEQDLAWLISMVNGLNTQTGNPNPYTDQTIKITKDLDMSAYSWVPIGTTAAPFEGVLDGGGHVIKGIYCSYISGDGGTGSNLGLFGVTNGATIHDLFIQNARLMVKNQTSGTYSMGAIVDNATNTQIYNCTAASKMESTLSGTTMGGLVGNFVSGTIHSSAAMPEMTGYTMGGLVGTNAASIYNSYANPQFTYSGSGSEYVGGLVATTTGTVENCYARFSRASSLGSAKFGRLAGDAGSSQVSQCYTPANCTTVPTAINNYGTLGSGCNTYGDVVAPYLYSYSESTDNIVTGTDPAKTLNEILNNWVTTNNSSSGRPTCVFWKRTTAGGYSATAGDINGDYPIHKYLNIDNDERNAAYNSVASIEGISLDYAISLDAMLTRHMSNATLNLYANDANVTGSTGHNVMVYIDEDISLLQDVSGSKPAASVIEAYTAQTLTTGSSSRWHFISSSLSDSGIGFDYGTEAQVGFNWSENPCDVTFSENDDEALFPHDVPNINKVDLYVFFEPEYHWINLKRNSNSHWHMNDPGLQITYPNETELVPGKGYLASIDKDQLLQNHGTLNNGDVKINVDYTPSNAWAGLLGYNLLGNPYQSYLNFSDFAAANGNLWSGKAESERTYAVYDPEVGGYLQYKEGVSRGAKAASGDINPHQGFLVKATSASEVTFTNAMRSNTNSGSGFRATQPAYPLVNLMVTDDEGDSDVAVLELGRDSDEGAEKLRTNTCKGWLYLHHNNDDYAILFRSELEDYQPLWFEATEAGTYTLSWNTANGEFDELMLIDNIAGVKTDMLVSESYVFEADPEQYKSRFKIVIGDYKEIEEYEDGPSTGSGAFAFRMGDELVVNGEGCLEVIDMLGRIVRTDQLQSSQSTVRKPETAGVYVLRLTGRDGVRTQKMVVE